MAVVPIGPACLPSSVTAAAIVKSEFAQSMSLD